MHSARRTTARVTISAEGYRPIECPAPGIIDRQPVNAPMETGLLAIDSMFPIAAATVAYHRRPPDR